MLRDPGFQVSALAGWAVAATALLRDSLVTGEVTGVRTFNVQRALPGPRGAA
jgi:hypothetical protein